MVSASKVRRFRTNPIEIAIFFVVSVIFAKSLYDLFYGYTDFNPAALTPMAANPVSEGKGRTPASSAESFLNFEVKCETNPLQAATSAAKVRLTGPLCGVGPAPAGAEITKTSVINNANRYNATVFTDIEKNKYSTDYIPLGTGKNPIHLEFHYQDGKTISQDLIFNKD